ncbi:MAG: hypothetical protein HY876_07635 [Coriobacteriales bacterium]|nr:hypothetical protein [Coriobacteriales bacterium]
MKRFIVATLCAVLAALVLGGCAPATEAKDSSKSAKVEAKKIDYSKLLTPADVKKASGVSVKLAKPNPEKGAAGDLNFVDGSGRLIVMANFGDKAWFDANTGGPNYREPLAGVGEAAFTGPSADVSNKVYQVGALKGDTAVLLTSFFQEKGGDPILSQAELAELAKAVVSRAE